MARFLAFLACVAAALASPLRHESRTSPPSGFVRKGAAPANETITFRAALTSSDIGGLERKTTSVSTPGSRDFRQWLSASEVKAFVQPSSDTVVAFSKFAASNGLSPSVISPQGDWVSFTATVAQANELFSANFETFEHPLLKTPLTRTLAITIPDELVGHIDAIHPTTSFEVGDPRLIPFASTPPVPRDVDAACNSTITPTCLGELYGIPVEPVTQPNNTILVTGYAAEWVQLPDISQFLSTYRTDIDPNTNFTIDFLDGGVNPQLPILAGSEADLDVEYTIGLATGVPITFLSTAGNEQFSVALANSVSYIAGLESPPTVMTTSYGTNEDQFTPSLLTKICNGYMAIGARGVSVINASGDGGVRGNHDTVSQCTNDTFIAVFPASCPWVTSVGSTLGIAPERAINFTGGGFSNAFARPAWQDAAVSNFLTTVPEDFSGVFNDTGRAYPDVSAQGWNFEVVIGGNPNLIGGTSASAPTFASIIALINDKLFAADKPQLGFLNPWLYSTASQAFTDVTIGKNVGYTCSDNATAFTAAAGWDPLTGWGTPIFSQLLELALV